MTTLDHAADPADRTQSIARLNDNARKQILATSRVVFTRSLIDTLIGDTPDPAQQFICRAAAQAAIMRQIENAEFSPENDPHGERDFGVIFHGDHKLFWKIDVYEHDGSFSWGAERPWDPESSCRVLTIMLASDY